MAEDDGLILLEVVVNNPESVNEPIEVSFSCDNGTAVGGLQFSGEFDYFVNRTRINILPGTISTFVEVGIIFDNRDEGTEVFFCRLDAVPSQSSTVEFPDPDRGIVPIFISDQVRGENTERVVASLLINLVVVRYNFITCLTLIKYKTLAERVIMTL